MTYEEAKQVIELTLNDICQPENKKAEARKILSQEDLDSIVFKAIEDNFRNFVLRANSRWLWGD